MADTGTDASKKFTCDVEGCQNVYSRRDNFQQHGRQDHGINLIKSGRFVCIGCSETFYHRIELIRHLKSKHDVDVEKDRKLQQVIS